jgi:rubrerythrin
MNMLGTKIETTADLMTIALNAEREAIRRYSRLAAKMREGGNESAAALFERMTREEEEHVRLIKDWMAQEQVVENRAIAPVRWHDPNVPNVYDDEAQDPYYSSPYRALAFAVHNEEIAFRFYTHVAANSENSDVCAYAEVLAREELGHAALLRAERRRAYHAEREQRSTDPQPDLKAVRAEEDLLSVAIQFDRQLLEDMNRLASEFPALEAVTKRTQQQIERNEKMLRAKRAPGEPSATDVDKVAQHHADDERPADLDATIDRLCRVSDRAFVFYDAVVESAEDEAVMLTAQQLATTALDHIRALKDCFGD